MVPRKGREEYKKLYIVEERKTAEEKLEKFKGKREKTNKNAVIRLTGENVKE